jgi:hypothetical protein
MLANPPPSGGPAFNLSAALVLASVIGGLSRVFFSTTKGDQKTFIATAERYPLADEPANAVKDRSKFAELLYKTYRNNLVHSLGLTVDDKGPTYKIVAPRMTPKIGRGHALTEHQLAALEATTGRPAGLVPTMQIRSDGVLILSAEALYWGTRRLVRDLAHDQSLHANAVAFLAPWYSPTVYGMRSTTATTMSTTAPTYVTSTAGPAFDVSIHADWPPSDK